jgi:hypothetical protein
MGEEAVVPVSARLSVTATGVQFVTGECYYLTAHGWWFDGYLPGDPNGVFYLPFLLQWLKPALRDPDAPWYSLIGTVMACRERHQFLIGREALITARLDGELLCSANDIPGFYWNNFGGVCLRIKRVE